jgi:dihydroorotate dehydrogenase electron transfer subunit
MKAKILSNREVAPGCFRLTVEATVKLLGGRPGQFVMVRGDWGTDPFLKRPFSICRFRKESGSFEIIYKAVGRGTGLLSQLSAQDYIDVLGPLGNGFPDPANGKPLLVAGGIGVAPLISLAEVMGGGVPLIMGGKDIDEVSYIDEDVKELGIDVTYTTEDGSYGRKGTAVSAMAEVVTPEHTVYTCGPKGMLVEIKRHAKEIGFSAYVSYEERMGCGTGLCFGCVVEGADGGYRLVCVDGPVFNINEISFEEI